MKRTDKIKRHAEQTLSKIRSITRHIRNVQDNCLLLGEKLIERGEIDLGKQLIANGFVHDVSKFYGMEFENLAEATGNREDEVQAKLKLKMAVLHHSQTNSHHAEYWNGIKHMPRVAVAEMVCDWKARSEEFGTSLRDWIDEKAKKRWNFTEEDDIYKEIMEFVDLICQKPFEQIKP